MKAFLISLFVLCAACVSMQPDRAASIRIECNVPDAAVIVDDVMLGRVAELSKEVRFIRPGFYRVEFRHPAYFTHYTEFEVAHGGVALVRAELHPLLE